MFARRLSIFTGILRIARKKPPLDSTRPISMGQDMREIGQHNSSCVDREKRREDI